MRIDLSGNDWLFKDFYGEDWRWRGSHLPHSRDIRHWRKGSVPGSPLHDLLVLGEVPDPYFERNSLLVEWVPQRTWLYKKTFNLPVELTGRRLFLHFEGVDYQAEFFLNRQSLGEHTGSTTPTVFEITEKVQAGEENLIAVVIEPAPHELPQVGRTNEVSTMKSRMGYWWDFCPRMINVGIWDDVYLQATGPVQIADVFIHPVLSGNPVKATIEVTCTWESSQELDADLEIRLQFEGKEAARAQSTCKLSSGKNELPFTVEISDPFLWWTNGSGKQPLYEAEVSVLVEGKESDKHQTAFGIRDIQFVQNEGAAEGALPYTLQVNGQKIYIKGWNWVPLDVMYGVPRPEKLAHLLRLAKEAHVNLLRVWGGGLIEKESFYDLCDKLGILVWQEFTLSSSGIDNNPSQSPEYVEMVRSMAEQIVPRRRNHPSLALWCGGNELQAGSEQPLDDRHPLLEALKEIVNRLDPGRAWLPTSSSGPTFSNSLENIHKDPASLHDVHGPWEYQGVTKQCELYNQGASLLHSEFGAEGITNRKTLDAVIAPENQLPVDLDSDIWFHLGAWWIKRPSWDQIFGKLEDIDSLVKATHYLQYSGLGYAVEADRRRKFHNSGTLPWQFNEPFPMAACTSAVDYYGRPKPVYNAVKRAYEPVHISAKFPTFAWAGRDTFEAEIWANNSEQKQVESRLSTRIVGVSGKVYAEEKLRISVPPNSAARLMEWKQDLPEEDIFFLDLHCKQQNGKVLSQNRYCFSRTENYAPLLAIPETVLKVNKEADQMSVTNTGGRTALFVWLEDARDVKASGYVTFDDNYFCLFPGETRTVRFDWHGVDPDKQRIEISAWNYNHP